MQKPPEVWLLTSGVEADSLSADAAPLPDNRVRCGRNCAVEGHVAAVWAKLSSRMASLDQMNELSFAKARARRVKGVSLLAVWLSSFEGGNPWIAPGRLVLIERGAGMAKTIFPMRR